MDYRYPPPFRAPHSPLLLGLWAILAWSCSFEMKRPCADGLIKDGKNDVVTGCGCETVSAKRCAANTIQFCDGVTWTNDHECIGPQVCVQSQCVSAGSGCPDRGTVLGLTRNQSFSPVLVSECIAGGNTGRDITYSEDSAEIRVRALSISLQNCPNSQLDFTQLFGVDVQGTVSSVNMASISGNILPGQYAVFYRQSVEIHYEALLWRYDTVRQEDLFVGTATLTDYKFIPDFATGLTCIPPSTLSPSSSASTCNTWMDNCYCQE